MPFGEELFAGTGSRSSQHGYQGGDDVRQQFTQYERDNETGLDYAGARYYLSTMGRFTSPDDFLNDTHASDPQSWNLFAYAHNNPLMYIDPTGQTIENTSDKKHRLSEEQMKALEKDLRAKTGLQSIAFQNGKLTYDSNEVAKGGSAKLREAITGAINDTKNVFQVGDYSGSKSIQFAETDGGSLDKNTGITTYQVKFDFADFRNARDHSHSEVMDSFSFGLNLYHEIDHKVSYDPSNPIPRGFATIPDVSPRPGISGVIDNVNIASSQLNLILRDRGAHTGQKYTGHDSSYKNTYYIPFDNGKKFLRWKLEGNR